MIFHWRQCKWQTHFALLREMSLLSLASFCQIRAEYLHCTSRKALAVGGVPSPLVGVQEYTPWSSISVPRTVSAPWAEYSTLACRWLTSCTSRPSKNHCWVRLSGDDRASQSREADWPRVTTVSWGGTKMCGAPANLLLEKKRQISFTAKDNKSLYTK